ncbi:MAG: SPFH domain-containing protein [Lachnospiraceae bacterium]|nr:SPFH domain-containing protein [Lachnospiraceae bacterium]
MGLVRAIFNAASETLADQWVDFITCDSLSSDVLMAPGERNTPKRSGNTRDTGNIISNGSKINVADGQCILICENGAIVDFCAQPGQYIYNNKIQPSLFGGGFKDLAATFQQIGKRFAASGEPTDEQFVFFVNTKEIVGNKIGFGNIPFRDSEFQFTIKVQGFGMYSFKVVDPLLFYKNVVGNRSEKYTRAELASQMKAEVIAALQPALGKIASQHIAYDQLINFPLEIGMALNDTMSTEWSKLRGIKIVKLALESITVDNDSAKKIEQFQEARILSNPAMAAGRWVSSTARAMETAAGNQAGALTGFMGMGFAQNAGGANHDVVNSLYQMASEQKRNVASQNTETPKPDAYSYSWTCGCGANCSGNFCNKCGGKKPQGTRGWECICGAINTGKFCSTCGSKKPMGIPQYKCDKCGWVPSDPEKAPKFCPECGDPFNDDDVII